MEINNKCKLNIQLNTYLGLIFYKNYSCHRNPKAILELGFIYNYFDLIIDLSDFSFHLLTNFHWKCMSILIYLLDSYFYS